LIGLSPNISHEDFLEIIETISTSESIEDLISGGRKLVGLKYGLYHHIPAVGASDYSRLNRFWTTGLNQSIRDYLDVKSGDSDPVLQYIFGKARAYWMTDLLLAEEFSGDRDQYRINLALDNIGDGLLVPLFGPFQKRGYVFVGFEKPRAFFEEIFLWQIQSILHALHVRYCLLVESLKTSIRLTDRESEVLELITFGKTNPEIGIILGISPSTVAGHVKRLFLKFDVSDRVTVALRAHAFIRQT